MHHRHIVGRRGAARARPLFRDRGERLDSRRVRVSSAAGMDEQEAARLRREYESEGLVEEEMADDPFAEFESWMEGVIAAELPEPNAFVLATVDQDGSPSARAVLMKGFSKEGLVFYTNLESRKSRDLKANKRAAATFVWVPLHRQVRFEGEVVEVEEAVADAYFATRPRGAKIAAHASRQSEATRLEELQARYEELKTDFGESQIPRPAHWGGWRLRPHRVEFWQGQPDRFHDRIRYQLEDGSWPRERLAP